MQPLIVLLVLFSIASVAFAATAKEGPRTSLLHQPLATYEPTGFLAKRILKVRQAFLRAVGPLARFLNEKIGIGDRVKRNIVAAGSQLTPGEFLACKALITVGIFVLATFFPVARENIVLLFLAGVVGWITPDLWMRRKMKKRHKEIMRDLPLIMDLLILCIDAGLDFMLAVERTIREYKNDAVIISELKELSREIKMGFTRTQALRNLSARINMPEVSSFSRTLIQADRLGSPIGDALRIQAEELRIRRFQKGEEMALKAPIKLLAPLLFCILPVVLIIVGGPILLRFVRGGISIGM